MLVPSTKPATFLPSWAKTRELNLECTFQPKKLPDGNLQLCWRLLIYSSLPKATSKEHWIYKRGYTKVCVITYLSQAAVCMSPGLCLISSHGEPCAPHVAVQGSVLVMTTLELLLASLPEEIFPRWNSVIEGNRPGGWHGFTQAVLQTPSYSPLGLSPKARLLKELLCNPELGWARLSKTETGGEREDARSAQKPSLQINYSVTKVTSWCLQLTLQGGDRACRSRLCSWWTYK